MDKTLILCAGMYRSGSTLQFNILRVILEQSYGDIYSCFADSYNPDDEREIHLVKIHDYDPELKKEAKFIFTSIRDRQEIISSIKRINEWDKTLYHEMIDLYLNSWLYWATASDYIQPYKKVSDILYLIEAHAYHLGLIINTMSVKRQLESEMVDPGPEQIHHDPKTLLHHKHLSNGA